MSIMALSTSLHYSLIPLPYFLLLPPPLLYPCHSLSFRIQNYWNLASYEYALPSAYNGYDEVGRRDCIRPSIELASDKNRIYRCYIY
jgi:hypothetical protein